MCFTQSQSFFSERGENVSEQMPRKERKGSIQARTRATTAVLPEPAGVPQQPPFPYTASSIYY